MKQKIMLILTISAFSVIFTHNALAEGTTSTTGETVKDGTNTITKTKAPKAIYDLFGPTLNNAKKATVSVDELSDKIIGVYFSAHWCPPCRGFTPKLVDFYNLMQKEGKAFEVVFVSSDRDQDAMYSYMTEMKMPWLALPYGDKHKNSLKTKYNVRGIPKLVIISPSGELITDNGRGDVTKGGVAVYDKWQTSQKKQKAPTK